MSWCSLCFSLLHWGDGRGRALVFLETLPSLLDKLLANGRVSLPGAQPLAALFFLNLRELKENNSHTVSWWLFFILYSCMFSLCPLYCILFSCSLYISRQYQNYSVVTFCFPVDDSSEYRANSENISLTWLTVYIVQVRDRLSPEPTYTPPFIRIDSPTDYMLLLASLPLLFPVPPHFTSYLDLLHFSLRKQTCF